MTTSLRSRLTEPTALVALGAHDGLTGRIAERSGIEALYHGGYALAAHHFGLPDVGLVGRAEVVESVRRMRAATDLPIVVDADTGYGSEAGADLVFVDAPRSVEEYRTIAERCPTPCVANMSETGRSPTIPTPELEEMGYRLVIFPSTQTWVFAKAYEELCRAVVGERTTASLADRFTSFDDVNALLGLAEWQSR